MRTWLGAAIVALVAGAPAAAASDRFAIEYRVERADAAKLPLSACLATAERVSAGLGYVPMLRNVYPDKLAVFAAGPRGGGRSLLVTCIGVDAKTAYVAQGLDYLQPQSAAARRAADAVHQALLRASR